MEQTPAQRRGSAHDDALQAKGQAEQQRDAAYRELIRLRAVALGAGATDRDIAALEGALARYRSLAELAAAASDAFLATGGTEPAQLTLPVADEHPVRIGPPPSPADLYRLRQLQIRLRERQEQDQASTPHGT